MRDTTSTRKPTTTFTARQKPMTKQLFDVNPHTREVTYHHYDEATDITMIEVVQDAQPYIERSKRLANNPEYKRAGIKQDWYHFASVPNTVLVELKQKYHLDWTKKDDLQKIEKVLARDYKKLLTVDKI